MSRIPPSMFSSSFDSVSLTHMATITQSHRFPAPGTSRRPYLSRFPPLTSISFPQSTRCRCRASSDESGGEKRPGWWEFSVQDSVKAAVKRFEDYFWSFSNQSSQETRGDVKEEEEKEVSSRNWDWERWKRHFDEVDEKERIVALLKAQLKDAVYREDYGDAAKLHRAISAANADDVVGTAIRLLNSAIDEERYYEAAGIRDNAGTGLIGWWSGISEDSNDPNGRIIRISAERGRYVARSYTPRQLATGRSGFPLFQVYFTMGDKGEYKQQAVYMKRKTAKLESLPNKPSELPVGENLDSSIRSSDEKGADVDDSENDPDITDGFSGIQDILKDMIPGANVKVLKVVSPEKVDRDLISKVIEQIMEEEDDDDDDDDDNVKDFEIESSEVEDNLEKDSGSEEIIVDNVDATIDTSDGQSGLSVEFIVSGIPQNLNDKPLNDDDFVCMPASLEKTDRFSFSIMTEDGLQNNSVEKEKHSPNKVHRPPLMNTPDIIMADLAKTLASRKRIPLKLLKDIGDLINHTVNQDQIQKPLSGKVFFSRIIIPTTTDPLSGLYISSRGMLNSEVLYLKRKFGQWQEDGKQQNKADLEFYEYVEALKLIGDPSMPAGQVVFRAKVGKQNQLPHKGIIPDEFGVVARYKGQGRFAEPGFRNPRWVDGELVILDGKYIRGGPVIGFVHWAPENNFLTFFNRLMLQN